MLVHCHGGKFHVLHGSECEVTQLLNCEGLQPVKACNLLLKNYVHLILEPQVKRCVKCHCKDQRSSPHTPNAS